MSKATRPTLAALIGAASLTLGTASAGAQQQSARPAPSMTTDVANVAQAAPAAAPASLRAHIEQRLDKAAAQGRHDDIDQLATLWLTLERRNQLDRVVDRGDGFINVALRNQRYSELRSRARSRRATVMSGIEFEVTLPPRDGDIDERIDVERFVSGLEAPYREAVTLSLSGMNHREVAEELGVSHAAARKWAQRLRQRLANEDIELFDS